MIHGIAYRGPWGAVGWSARVQVLSDAAALWWGRGRMLDMGSGFIAGGNWQVGDMGRGETGKGGV